MRLILEILFSVSGLGGGVSVGQNMASGQSSWDAAVSAWHSEIVNFTFGVSTTKKVGHFTQVSDFFLPNHKIMF